jgi:hypothetical protein
VSFDAIMDALRRLDDPRRDDFSRRESFADGEAVSRLDA